MATSQITPLPGYAPDPNNVNGVVAANPVVTPASAPQTGSLQGTMTQPLAPQTRPNNPSGPGLDPTSFMNVLAGVKQSFASNNDLIAQKNLLLKGRFTSPLSTEQIAQLTPDVARVYNSGNKDAIDLQIHALNERIQGSTTNFSQAVNYLVNGYQSSIQEADAKRKEALANVQNMIQTYGRGAISGLEVQYPELKPYLEQLKGIPTLAEKELAAKNQPKGVDTQVVDVGGRKYLINSKTGDTIKEIAGTSGTDTKRLAVDKSNIDTITALTRAPGLQGSVGPSSVNRGEISLPFGIHIPFGASNFTGSKSDFIGSVQQVQNQLTLENLQNAKANGATFGALSEGELSLLNSSATKLGTWAIKDEAGNVTGYKASESDFKKELDKINNFAKLDYILKGGDPTDVGVEEMQDGTLWSKNSDGTYTQLQ